MFGDRRLIVIGLICFAGLAACSTNPPAPGPVGPTPAPLHGYHLTLYDQNGNVTRRYDVGHPILSGMIQSIRTFRFASVARCNIFTVRIKRTRTNLPAGSALLVRAS
jgi:hypothetical protein